MAQPDNQTAHRDRDRTKGESAFEDSEAAGGAQGVTQDKPAAKTRVDAAKASETDSDWNLSSGSTGMAKETKIGLALCVLLIGAFAFVVYSKMNKKTHLEDEFAASTDSESEDAPPPFGGEPHADFGGEPGHDHGHGHSHDHGDAFNDDRHATIDNFDVPQRKQDDHAHDEQHGAEPWQTSGRQTTDSHAGHQHAAGGDDPFSQASHQHKHDGHDHGPARGEDEFGFEQDRPKRQKVAAKQDKKSWNLADFLGSKPGDTATKPAPEPEQQAAFEDTAEEPFGLQPSNQAQQPAEQTADGFNPFASTEDAESAQRQKIQQSAARTFVDDPHKGHDHDHGHKRGVEGEPEFDAWGSDQRDDIADSRHPGQSTADSTTRIQRTGDGFDAFDEPALPGHSQIPRDDFSGDNSGRTMPAPEPTNDPHSSPFGGQDGHNHPTHDEFSQPFSGDDDHQHGGHSHGDGGHFVPEADDFAQGSDRPAIYEAQRGDTFWDISKQHYGAGRYYKALASFNRRRIPDPRKMRPGMKVLIPRPEVLEARFPSLCPWRTAKPTGEPTHSHHKTGFFTNVDGRPRYRVGAEDTLTAIAQDHLGRASRWVQVFALNRDRIGDPAKLKIGTILRLPADASRVQLVRRNHLHR